MILQGDIVGMAIISRGCPNLNWILTLLFTDSSLAVWLDFLRWLRDRVDFKGDTVLLVVVSELTRCRIRNPGTLRNRFGDFTQLVTLQNERYWKNDGELLQLLTIKNIYFITMDKYFQSYLISTLIFSFISF